MAAQNVFRVLNEIAVDGEREFFPGLGVRKVDCSGHNPFWKGFRFLALGEFLEHENVGYNLRSGVFLECGIR